MRNFDMAKNRISKDTESNSGSNNFFKITLVITVVAILIIIGSFYLWLRSDRSLREKIDSLDTRVSKIEDRLARIESTDKSNSSIDEKRTKFEISLMNRLDSLEALVNLKDSKAREDTLRREAKKQVSRRVKPDDKTNAHKKKYHIVTAGETLYRISVNYKISVDELRRLNNIGPRSVIHVGQKLRVAR